MGTLRAGTVFGIGASLAFGCALVWLALPRTIAYATLARDAPVMEALARGEPIHPRRALASIASRKQALHRADLAAGWTDVGALYLMLARLHHRDRTTRNAMLDRSIRAFGDGLALAPAQPFAWLQLAQARHARHPGGRDGFQSALRLSYLTAPDEPRVISQRVRLGFAARTILSQDMVRRIAGDVRLWATHDPRSLAEWARPHFALPWVRTALAGDEPLERRFVTSYLQLPAR